MRTPTASSPSTGERARVSGCIGTLLVLASMVADADEFRQVDPPLDFSLYLQHNTTDLDYPNARVPTQIDRIGVQWREYYAPLWLNLMLGYSWVTQTRHAPTAGLELRGYHAALGFGFELYAADRLRITLDGNYLYERADEENSGDEVELTWQIPSAQLLAQWRVVPTIDVYGGARYEKIDGQERRRDTVNITTDLEHDAKTGGVAGVRVRLDDSGYVLLEGSSSATRSVTLSFGRRY